MGMRWRMAVLGVMLAGLLLVSCAAGGETSATESLAREGGSRLVLFLSCPIEQPGCDIRRQYSATLVLLRRRLWEGMGLRQATVRPLDATHISIELPGVRDDSQVLDLLAQRGQIAVLDTLSTGVRLGSNIADHICAHACQPGQYRVLFTAAQFDPAQVRAEADPQTNQPILIFGFAGAAQGQFAKYTRSRIGGFLTITLDGVVIESATIQSEIDGPGEITGFASLAQARNLATLIRVGPLPLMVRVASDDRYPGVASETPTPQTTPTPSVSPGRAPTTTTGP
jgi:hypothetical protein